MMNKYVMNSWQRQKTEGYMSCGSRTGDMMVVPGVKESFSQQWTMSVSSTVSGVVCSSLELIQMQTQSQTWDLPGSGQ